MAAIEAIAGVAGVTIEGPIESPRVRIVLSGTRPAAEVRAEVQAALDAVLASLTDADVEPGPGERRSGLGRGLAELVGESEESAAPTPLLESEGGASSGTPRTRAGGVGSVAGPGAARGGPRLTVIPSGSLPRPSVVAIEQAATGVSVRVVDASGREARVDVVEGLEAAVVSATAQLAGVPAELVGIEHTRVEDHPVIVVLIRDQGRSLRAGAAVVSVGTPFAVAEATWEALTAAE